MEVVVWVPGRARPRALEAAERVYAERLALVKVDVVAYRVEKVRSGAEDQARTQEGAAFLKSVRADDFLVVTMTVQCVSFVFAFFARMQN